MSAIKCFINRLTQGRALRIIDYHRCPRQRLERDPVQPDCAAERENREGTTNATKHAHEASGATAVRQWRGRSSVIQSRAIFDSELCSIRHVDIRTTAERIEKYRSEFTFVPVFR
jgi:hypothetical protein